MAVISTNHLKVYQGNSIQAEVLVLYGHGDIGENDNRTYDIQDCTLHFYVEEGYICNVIDNQLASEIRNDDATPLYIECDGDTVPDYWIHKYRGRGGFEQSNHYSDDYYVNVAKQCNVDIIRVRHRYDSKKKRFSDIIDYATSLGYDTIYCLHCRFVKKSFSGQVNPNKKQKNYRSSHTSRPKFLA